MDPIINAHAHTFTIEHVPENFLPMKLPGLLRIPLLRAPLTFAIDTFWPFSNKDQYSRLASFIRMTYKRTQRELLEELAGYYPRHTRFIVLSMDMEHQNAGKVRAPLEQQLNDLVMIKQDPQWTDRLLPFVAVDPRRPNVVDLVKRYIEDHNFAGVKLYPPLGFWPSDPRLDPVYEYCDANRLPIMTHTSRGGVYYKGKLKTAMRTHPVTGEIFPKQRTRDFSDRFADPDQFRHVLNRFRNLRLCFAHYGGEDQWREYLVKPWFGEDDPMASFDVSGNWLHKINRLIGEFDNVYTDVSYTLHDQRFIPLLKMFLLNQKQRERILFGTDYYMLENDVAEREIAVSFRFWIGEVDFAQLAKTNNHRFLAGGA